MEEHAADETHADAADAHATTEAEAANTPRSCSRRSTRRRFASQILWFAITFGALYLLMSRVALPQIGSILDKRKARIEGDLKEAERLRGETDKAVAAYEQALAEARKNAHGIAEETRDSIKADLDGKRKVVEDDLAQEGRRRRGAHHRQQERSAWAASTRSRRKPRTALVTQLTGEANAGRRQRRRGRSGEGISDGVSMPHSGRLSRSSSSSA